MDLTEVGDLDDLQRPEGVIGEAQALAAAAFGADESFFLVNGVTAGIHASIAACASGGRVLVPRNAHRSVVGALILAGAEPVWVMPEYDSSTGVAGGVAAAEVEARIASGPPVSAGVLVHPTYHGITGDTSEVVQLLHARGVPVIADEAHGAHFYFGRGFPATALACGSDAGIAGCHKTAGAFTQGAVLNVRGRLVDVERLRAWLRVVQTTSPSYILMASIDSARQLMATRGREHLSEALDLAEDARRRISERTAFTCPGDEWTGRPGFRGLDRAKLTVITGGAGLDGRTVARTLQDEHGIMVEFAQPQGILAIVTYADDPAGVRRLVAALEVISRRAPRGNGGIVQPELPRIPAQAMPPRRAFLSRSQWTDLETARGRVAADIVAVYPPGIPVLCPGEIVEDRVVEYVRQSCLGGYHVHGVARCGESGSDENCGGRGYRIMVRVVCDS